MNEIEEITKRILEFRDARDWEKYHNGKDLAICLNREASELLELFLWKNPDDVDTKKLRDELADVIYAAFLISHKYKLNVKEIVLSKLKKNNRKYPSNRSKVLTKNIVNYKNY